ncbi:MAG: hypothetical protein HY748_17235 [Elusimicrobia bacterium]|nr:hypothetical protein [Elusimicrobiota bacterium]
MTPPDVRPWLVAWFERKGQVAGSTLEEKIQTDYFAAGLIDSLGVVSLIADVEGAFSIRFSDRHYQERRFSTIGGLAEIVSELVAVKPA